jgi:hypothetical protein
MKVSELAGAQLDCWVAKALGIPMILEEGRMLLNTFDENHRSSPTRYSSDWAQGGPIIERELAGVYKTQGYAQHLGAWTALTFAEFEHRGPTPLIAAMRAYVGSKFGAEVTE